MFQPFDRSDRLAVVIGGTCGALTIECVTDGAIANAIAPGGVRLLASGVNQ